MKNKAIASRDDKIFNIFIYVVSSIIMLLVLYPLVFVVSASFSNPDLVINGKVLLFPKGFTIEPYKLVFKNPSIWTGYKNTILYMVLGTVINVIFTVMLAYPLSRRDLPARNVFMFLLAFTMYFNGGLIPTYLLVRDLHMENKIWAMVIPNAIATYNVIITRTFFQTNVPDELYEAAAIDGCSNIRMLTAIVLPISKAIIAINVLFYGVAHWNAYFNALIYLRKSQLYPLQLILREILILNQTEEMGSNSVGMGEKIMLAESIKYSVIVVSSVPVLLMYPFVQKYFVKGVMIGAIKG
jgi:putative aldouronate transport system permease protein